MNSTVPLSTGTRAGYALGSLATGAFGTVPGLLLLPYLTDSLGVAAAVAGLLVLLPKVWDALINPLVGRVSDRTVSRWGARRPYLLFGGISLAVLFAAMFAAPLGSGAGAATYVALMFLLTATAFACYQVPYVAMPAEMTDAYSERTRLMTWRIAVLAVAILVSGAVAPLVVNAGHGGVAGHRLMGLFVGALILLGALGSFLGTRRAPMSRIEQSEPSLRAQLAIARDNVAFRTLLIVFVIQSIGIATMLAGVKYVADHVLQRPDDGPTLLFAAFVGPALVVMPLWIRLGARWGKKRSLVVASLVYALGALALVTTGSVPPALTYAITAVIGCGYAGQQVFALAMLPDCIAWDERRTGKRQAGVFTGVWTAGETIGLAIGPGLFGLIIALAGYRSSSTGVTVQQSGTARLGILLAFTVLPALLVGVATLLLRRYHLEAERVEAQPAPVGSVA
jgi:glycoside/pentoside/hexuronide:cation symporter, GPH family